MTSLEHPARHFIYYLLSRRVYDAKQVIVELSDFGLPVPKRMFPDKDLQKFEVGTDFHRLVQQILKTRAAMDFPQHFDPQQKNCSPETRAFLEFWKIGGIWRSDRSVVTAIELLMDPPIRSALELFLLSPLAMRDIAHRLCVRFELDPSAMNASVVRAFSHYFWDVNALDHTQWKAFVQVHRGSNADEYLATLTAPRNAAGAAYSIAVVDRDMQLLTPVERYSTASAMAFSMLMRQATSNATGAPYAAFTALNMMRMADDELEKHQGGSSELLAEWQKLRTLHDQNKPTTVLDAPYVQRPLLLAKTNEEPDGNP